MPVNDARGSYISYQQALAMLSVCGQRDSLLHPKFLLLGQALKEAARRRDGVNYGVKLQQLLVLPLLSSIEKAESN